MRYLLFIFTLFTVQRLYAQKDSFDSKQKTIILFTEDEYKTLTDSQKIEKIMKIENNYLYQKPYPLIIIDGIPLNTTGRNNSTGRYQGKEGFESSIDYDDISEIIWIDDSLLGCNRVQIIYTKPKKPNPNKKNDKK